MNGICSYCDLEMGHKGSFSYGVPGVTRIYCCHREWLHNLSSCRMRGEEAKAQARREFFLFLQSGGVHASR